VIWVTFFAILTLLYLPNLSGFFTHRARRAPDVVLGNI
jgi:hypothetical protein